MSTTKFSAPETEDATDSTRAQSGPEVEGRPAGAAAAPTGEFDFATLLANGGTDLTALTADPQALLKRWLDQRRVAAEEQAQLAAESEAEDLELRRLDEIQAAQQREERRARLRELRDVVRDLYGEVEQLRGRNDRLAAALGACHLCLGEDDACAECGGRGRPGSAPLDRSLFRDLVLPAVRRLRDGETSGLGGSPWAGGATGYRPTTEEEAARPKLYV